MKLEEQTIKQIFQYICLTPVSPSIQKSTMQIFSSFIKKQPSSLELWISLINHFCEKSVKEREDNSVLFNNQSPMVLLHNNKSTNLQKLISLLRELDPEWSLAHWWDLFAYLLDVFDGHLISYNDNNEMIFYITMLSLITEPEELKLPNSNGLPDNYGISRI